MTYTQEQKDLLLDKLFDGVICLDIYNNIEIIHKNSNISYYIFGSNTFRLSWSNIWKFFENEKNDNQQEIEELTSNILIDLTKREGIKTHQRYTSIEWSEYRLKNPNITIQEIIFRYF